MESSAHVSRTHFEFGSKENRTLLDVKVAWARNTRVERFSDEDKYDPKGDFKGEFDRRPKKYGIAVITTGEKVRYKR